MAEVERLLDAAGPGPPMTPRRTRAARDRALLEFLYGDRGAGSPRRPAWTSTSCDLDGDAATGRAAVRLDGKGGKQRVVPLGRYAARALEAYLVRARPALAAGATGGPGEPPRCS